MTEEKKAEEQNYEKLLEGYRFQLPTSGEVVRGKVIEITDKEVLVDIGAKIEGMIPIDEFRNIEGEITVKEGDELQPIVEKRTSSYGYIPLSKRKLEIRRAMEVLGEAYREGRPVEGKIIKKEKKGFSVEIMGIRAFLPASQLEIRPVKETYKYIGKTFPMKILDIRKHRGGVSVLVSRRVLIEEEIRKKKEEVLSRIKEGEWIKGVVKNITDFGVFVDLGGIDGLLPTSEISWGRVTDPRRFFKEGQEIEVLVLNFDREKERITLGYKQRTPDPWENIEEKYKPGDRVKGRVVSLTDFGAFIELEKGVEGLVRSRELSWTENIKDPHQIMSEGEIVEVEVLSVDPQERRIALSYRRTLPTPIQIFASTHSVGEVTKGKVKDVKDFGAFVELEPGVEALLRKSDYSWEAVDNLQEVLKKGEEIEVKILEILPEEGKVRVGRKQLLQDPFLDFVEKYTVGDELEAKVLNVKENGYTLELIPGVYSFLPKGKKDLQEGDTLKVRISSINPERRRVRVELPQSKTPRKKKKEKQAPAKPPTLGDLLPDSLKK